VQNASYLFCHCVGVEDLRLAVCRDLKGFGLFGKAEREKMEWVEGMRIELRSDEKALEGAWFEGTVTTPARRGDPCRIQLDKFVNDNGEPLVEEVQPDKMRPGPPQSQLAVPLEERLFVEAYDKDCWWRGFVVRRLFCGEEFWLVYFPGTKTLCAHRLSALRRAQDWKDGTWHLV